MGSSNYRVILGSQGGSSGSGSGSGSGTGGSGVDALNVERIGRML